jgi:lipid A 4'-phosphatase
VPTNQCGWGCSFVSGEAAASAFILAFCVIVPARGRPSVLIVGILITLAVSFARIAAGGHFLSDVVTAWFLTLLLMLVLHAQLYHGALLGPLKRWWPL